mmetsp:Transcript_47223/g.107032  ORF Transcript_47223/g.107032 Transcript_47223/m.107032 type:complete len:211 (-) Transcript_47223:402-1034(-)
MKQLGFALAFVGLLGGGMGVEAMHLSLGLGFFSLQVQFFLFTFCVASSGGILAFFLGFQRGLFLRLSLRLFGGLFFRGRVLLSLLEHFGDLACLVSRGLSFGVFLSFDLCRGVSLGLKPCLGFGLGRLSRCLFFLPLVIFRLAIGLFLSLGLGALFFFSPGLLKLIFFLFSRGLLSKPRFIFFGLFCFSFVHLCELSAKFIGFRLCLSFL